MKANELNLKGHIQRETFKTKSKQIWEAGTFEYELELDDLTDNEIDIIAEWLSENCTENFIVFKNLSEIVAGGSVNNLLLWNYRKVHGPDPDSRTINLKIRLSSADISAFRLTWVL